MPKATPLFLPGPLSDLRLLMGFPSAPASGLADQSHFPAQADLNTDGYQFTPISTPVRRLESGFALHLLLDSVPFRGSNASPNWQLALPK